MMNKILTCICFTLAILLLLTGCTSTIPKDTNPSNVINTPTQQEIYFATGNDYYDLYVGYSFVAGPEIRLYSREYINPNSIHVTADIQADYSVHITEQESGASLTTYKVIESGQKREVITLSADAYDFPLYIYQTYSNIDWAAVGQKYKEYFIAKDLYDAGEIGEAQVVEAMDRYNYAATEYINNYSKLTTEDIPRFFEYLIQIQIIDAEAEESFTTVRVSVGDTIYDLNIGEVYIRPYSDLSNGSNLFSMKLSAPLWFNSFPYGDGIEQCQTGTYYTEKALEITGLHFLRNTMSNIKVLDVVAIITDDRYAKTGIEIVWDGITPIYVEQGKYVTLYITVQDDRMKEINYHSKIYPVWEFECNGSEYEVVSEVSLNRYYSDKWLLYAMCLDGLDMESYFNDYYYVQVGNKWRNDVDLTPWGQ